jgi:hypothetical protein
MTPLSSDDREGRKRIRPKKRVFKGAKLCRMIRPTSRWVLMTELVGSSCKGLCEALRR